MKANHNLKNGLSGFLRIRNDEKFVGACIDSCIDALDELVIVYNDCTDSTPEIVEQKRRQYPDKIRVFPYDHEVSAFNLTEEQFEYVKNLPEGSPQLFSTYSNYPLTKIKYKYIIKLDSDQIYFADEIKKWKDVTHMTYFKWKPIFVLGSLFMLYFTFYRRVSAAMGRPYLELLPDWLVNLFWNSYEDYAKWRLFKGTACISLSGVNLFKDDDRWYVPFDGVNIHPPYNGEGDTVICRFTDETYFVKRLSDSTLQSSSYFVAESFHCPYKMMFTGPVWFHLHAIRENTWAKVKKMKDEHPEQFVPVEKFTLMTYDQVNDKMDEKAHPVYQRTLFALVHKAGVKMLGQYWNLLKHYNL